MKKNEKMQKNEKKNKEKIWWLKMGPTGPQNILKCIKIYKLYQRRPQIYFQEF